MIARLRGHSAMETNGRTTISSKSDVIHRAPIKQPPFTLSHLKKAIPPHCFNRSAFRSISYVFEDLILASLLAYTAATYLPLLPPPISYVAWPLYWFTQGCVLTGYWIIAHECGHHAFSDHKWLDDTVGFLIHSSLLVPYFSWKYSHRLHHSNTASLERDEVFVPKFKHQIPWFFKYIFNNPIGRAFLILSALITGWPSYLFTNVTGRNYGQFANHFYPYSPLFTDRERLQIFVSDAGVFCGGYVLWRVIQAKGLYWVFLVHGGPTLVMHSFLVIIIFLQHSHPSLPRYNSSEWDWLRGALSTVDRDYGVILNKVFHNVADTHVLHHLFTTIPHYNAVEATMAVKPILGEYYQFDGTPVLKALWRDVSKCIYVEADEGEQNKGVLWFRNTF